MRKDNEVDVNYYRLRNKILLFTGRPILADAYLQTIACILQQTYRRFLRSNKNNALFFIEI